VGRGEDGELLVDGAGDGDVVVLRDGEAWLVVVLDDPLQPASTRQPEIVSRANRTVTIRR
jgi:hypothetical protein